MHMFQPDAITYMRKKKFLRRNGRTLTIACHMKNRKIRFVCKTSV
jgi:hypothetical protein